MKKIDFIQIKNFITTAYSSLTAKHLIIICVLSILSYSNSLFNGFTWDDHVLIEGNQNIKTLKGIVLITFQKISQKEADRSDEVGMRSQVYRPASFFLFYLIGKVFGITPFGFHFVSIILHCLNSVLVYLLCVRLLLSARAALFASAIFAVHPIHTEAVASAMSMPDELMFFLGIISFLFLISTIKGNYVIAGLLFFAALMAKDSAVIFIAVYVGFIVYLKLISQMKQNKGKELIIAMVLIVPLILYFLMRYHVTGAFLRNPWLDQPVLDNPLLQATFAERIFTSIYILWKYFALFIFPVNLSADYSLGSISLVSSASDPRFIISIICLLVIAAGFIWLIVKKRWVEALGIYIFFICLLPVSNMLFIGITLMAERYLYLPSLGLCIVVGNLISAFAENRKRTADIAAYAAVAILVVVMIGLCIARNGVWKNDETLFSSVIQVYPHNMKATNNLAWVYYQQNKFESAIPLYNQVLQANPRYYRGYIYVILSYYEMNKMDDAIKSCQNAVRIFPQDEQLYDLLAELYRKAGNEQQSLRTYMEGIKQIPGSWILYARVGAYYFRKNDCQSAEEYLMNSLRINDNGDAHYYLAKCYYNRGKGQKALDEFMNSLSVRKKYPDVLKYLVLINIEFENYAQAEKMALVYLKEFPKSAEPYAMVALLYWRADQDFKIAYQYIKRAVSLDSTLCTRIEYLKLCRSLGF